MDIIKNALKNRGMTQKDLANAIPISPQAVSKWINDKSRPDIENAKRIYEILGIDVQKEYFMSSKTKYSKRGIEMKHSTLAELDNFDKCVKEATMLIDASEIRNKYSRPVITLLEWLLPSVIALTRHQQIKEDANNGIGYDNIHYNLMDYLETSCPYKVEGLYENYLEYNFYLMGGDLFESLEPNRIPDHNLVNCAMSWWYKFQKALIKSELSPIYCELLVAIADLADFVLDVA